jgi:Asp-tRNA(Asn)/Glu-tRNA(Gln) amidotransferase A subunit family amidase
MSQSKEIGMAPSFHELTALGVVEALRAGEFTVSDYVRGLISRIHEKDPQIEAWAYFDPALALAQASALDRRTDGADLPLAGVAVGVKDIIDTKDMPTENGTALDAGRRPSADAEAVRLLREAGAIIMGKTVTTELAFLHPSKTRNPHHGDHTPGGSSSGSAAAVASGMVPVALGTQTNGSVIRPASFCGVYAIKPTHDLVPRKGVLEEAGTFDTVGIFARSLDDLAVATAILAGGAAGRDGSRGFLEAVRTPKTGARFAFVKTPAWPLAEDTAKQEIGKAVAALGTACDEVTLPALFDRAAEFHRTIMLAEIALNFGPYYERGKDRLSPPMREAIELGRAVRGVDYAEALRAREALHGELSELTGAYDAILTLPAAGPAPKGLHTTGNPVFCTLWTYLGVPALNLPLLTINGLPLGIQVVGRRFGEGALFAAAARLEKELSARGQ